MILIQHKSQCCGCAACVQRCPRQCILLEEDAEGFLYPKVDVSRCIDCGLCEKVCPVLHPGTSHAPQACYAALHPDKQIREASSSGGSFTALAASVLASGGVVFGARFASDWSVEHAYTETLEGLAAFRGSKYVQSRIGSAYSQAETFLKQGRRVLFTGTPCQISGLRRFLRKDYEGLLTLDFICHGVPSPLVWRRYLQAVRPSSGDTSLRGVSFRDKEHGWHSYRVTFRYDHASVSRYFYEDPYMRGFLADLFLRPSCYACAAKSCSSGADLTMGDFWGIEHVHPELDDDGGVSCILVHTPSGARALQQIPLQLNSSTYQEVVQYNPALEHSPKASAARRSRFFELLAHQGVISACEELTRVSVAKRLLKLIRSLLGKVRRRLLR